MRTRRIAGRASARTIDTGAHDHTGPAGDASPTSTRTRAVGRIDRPRAAADESAPPPTAENIRRSPTMGSSITGSSGESSTVDDAAVASATASVVEPSEGAPGAAGDRFAWVRRLRGRLPADPRGRLIAALAVVTVLGALLAAVAGTETLLLRETGSARNGALSDAATTQAVIDRAGSAISAVFSYDYNDTAKTEQAAHQALTGRAIGQYSALFARIRQLAPAQQAVLTTTVRSVGLTRLSDDAADALVFVDQQALLGDRNERSAGATQLSVHLQRFGADWKITDITVL